MSSHKLAGWLLLLLLTGAFLGWYLTGAPPSEIRIATGAGGGLYYQVGTWLKPRIEKRTRRAVTLLETAGSVRNRELLLAGEADLAILQGGAQNLQDLLAIAPLYHEMAYVVIRRGRGIKSFSDLPGRRVAIGPVGSGIRKNTTTLLAHYRIDLKTLAEKDRYFVDLASDESLDAAFVMAGLLNPDLGTLLASGKFELLPITATDALVIRHPHLTPQTIPRGFFREAPPVPARDVPTVATTSFLASRRDAPSGLVHDALEAIYEDHLRHDLPTLIRRRQAATWDERPMHPAARGYFQPYSGLRLLAGFMESLAALKELLVALGAGLYLLWARWQRARSRQRQDRLQADKDRLDVFLNETMTIERAQMRTEDPVELRAFLDRVTEIKLRALDELTHEELKGDVVFTIFLQQCADLAYKIQSKIDGLAQQS